VTGSREFDDEGTVWSALGDFLEDPHSTHTLVHGACPKGADELARTIWTANGEFEDPHPADWGQYGKRAGFIRNQEMVDTEPDVCLGFFKKGAANKGTMDCVTRALKAGIPIRTYWA
jgi:hypothetical protein